MSLFMQPEMRRRRRRGGGVDFLSPPSLVFLAFLPPFFPFCSWPLENWTAEAKSLREGSEE